MTHFSFGLVVLLAVWSLVAARPQYPDLQQQYPDLQQQYPDRSDSLQQLLQNMPPELQYGDDNGALVRERRLTCDLLSFQSQWVTPNHAACAARCLVQFWKYKGGRCVNGSCQCTRHG